ncbi:MAG: hypothetical protein WDN06_07550 [Asticcacaulis sp.]
MNEACVLAVVGPSERYLAMIEGAYHVLVEMPGGGLVVSGDARARHKAREVIEAPGRAVRPGRRNRRGRCPPADRSSQGP